VTGLAAEARIAAGPGIATVSGGGDIVRLTRLIEEAIAAGGRAIISIGIAGGLSPGLAPGSCLVGRDIVTQSGERFEADRVWAQRLSVRLGGAPIVDLAGIDGPVVDPASKRALHVETGAVAADMESHVAARLAAAHNLPFAALRVVADPAERSLPHAALVGMRPDGGVALGAVFASLARNPRQIRSLMMTALDARAAFAALLGGRKMLAACSLGFGDLGELCLDVTREDVFGRSLPV
jgi:adenosylhomocysteine nucleosidase